MPICNHNFQRFNQYQSVSSEIDQMIQFQLFKSNLVKMVAIIQMMFNNNLRPIQTTKMMRKV